MKLPDPVFYDELDEPIAAIDETSEDDLWFLPGPIKEELDELPPGPRAEPCATAVLNDWGKAEAHHAAQLARVAGRRGALDDRLRRGPEGWRHRLALIEAAELSWFSGNRIGPDRPALWISLRLSGVQDDMAELACVGWAMRWLTGGPGPEIGLSAFLDRRDPENMNDVAKPLADRAGSWLKGTMRAHLSLRSKFWRRDCRTRKRLRHGRGYCR